MPKATKGRISPMSMIFALKDILQRLSTDPNDLFHVHVRQRVGKKATDNLEMKLKEFIFAMPDMVARIDEIMQREPEGSFVRRLSQYLLIYLYDTEDFLPERDKGLFGFLDDAYFVAIVYLMIVEKMEPSLRAVKDEKNRKFISTHLQTVRYVIPEESVKIERAVSDIVTHQILCYAAR